jgi:hypothetical protein
MTTIILPLDWRDHNGALQEGMAWINSRLQQSGIPDRTDSASGPYLTAARDVS